MIFTAFARALAQLGDRPFRRTLLLGLGLTLALLAGATVLFVGGIEWLTPDSFTLPWIGEITWIDNIASVAGVLLMLALSVFLMVPVAAAFTGLFLDDVADAVEARHYPELEPARRIGMLEGLRDALSFLGVLIAVNLVALVIYLLLAPAAPFVFWAVNGFLLGREYYQMVAIRRLGREGARRARRRHTGTIWLAGALMAVPLTVPVVNLLVPILGAASFTHLFHMLEQRDARRRG
ncbi:hypothetical protein BV394_12235 [Brevirhabdus pacifica]|uniref:Uncharacterized protein n=1 Tax=Brevirhabdus pacifica TaxID=1267768 RepID=A0A1U7DKI4_9RHOB|nr:EI24 domain-containing protein [Brevirhabdus pacifica]APX90403.1 hypothetical protein BV394_12235 [Brevirhabdus pacifica]OWU78573.1 membrane protein [Loktanella sp. 22II-4b]PJJ85507.1 uncharacterized protein involved in cysteine biosynthesis [Brevirhabdus pacifica]